MKNHLQRNLGFLLIGIGLLLITLGGYGLLSPDDYIAKTRLAISFDRPAIDDLNVPSGENPGTFAIAGIRSDIVLSNVVWELKLAGEQTGPASATQDRQTAKAMVALRKRLEVHPVPNTLLVDISVTDKIPAQAAQCANTLVIAYKNWVFNRQQSLVKAGIQELKHQRTLQEQKTAAIAADLNQLKESLNLPSPEPPKAELRTNYPALYQAKQKLEDENDVLKLLTRKIAIEESDLQSPGNSSLVEIVETAVPPTSPVRRKKLLGTILLVAGLGCCLWGRTVTRDATLTADPV